MTLTTDLCETIGDTRKRCDNTFSKEQNPSQDLCKTSQNGFCETGECPVFTTSDISHG